MAGVEAVEGSIFDVACDALVSPANSFGFMDGGLDLAISQHFGWHVQERLQARIRARHHGELLVGQADAVPTDDPAIPLVIAAPTMRVPMRLGASANPYLALRAVLLWVRHAHLDDGRPAREVVRKVAVPGLGTGVGGVPSGVCSRQMRAAYDQVVAGTPGFPRSWNEACARHEGLLR
ncbi:MAG: macro domain-containing protein [Planctomycetota bacterium]